MRPGSGAGDRRKPGGGGAGASEPAPPPRPRARRTEVLRGASPLAPMRPDALSERDVRQERRHRRLSAGEHRAVTAPAGERTSARRIPEPEPRQRSHRQLASKPADEPGPAATRAGESIRPNQLRPED